jgi:hypothetical protein
MLLLPEETTLNEPEALPITVRSTGPPHTVLLYGMLWNWFSVEIIVPDIVPVFIRTPS